MTLLAGPTARNMIRSLFVNKLALEKGAARPKNVPPVEVNTVGIIGDGLMGSGIAHVSAKAGMSVVVLDRTVEDAAKAIAYTRKLIDKDVARGKMTPEQADAFVARLRPTADYADLRGVDLVVEAVFEQPDVKADVIRQTEAVIREDVVFASNTSMIPIGDLAKHSRRPELFVGMHFFSPVERMPLLEITPHRGTGERAVAVAFDYNRSIRKTPIVVKDVRGFFTNQVFPPYVHEAILMTMEGVRPALIENCARTLGMPIGPLAVLDDTTLKLGLDVQEAARKELGDNYVPNGTEPFFEMMVNQINRAGRRFGAGFYDYGPKGERLGLWAGMEKHYPLVAAQPSPEDVKQRLLYAQLVPTARCYEEGVVQDPQSADLGAILGWGFPVWTGGPLSYIDTIGIATFVDTCDDLARRHGDRFSAPQLFRELKAKHASLYADAA
ncbi:MULTISPECIES: 3-hydroxyacyl-CoA dehydrogenase NAD-binding domain-containing protein [unclassified Bradyrhizobium]|uniref:3-hydroxyacyl-CoA dehydrogenase NAD-binding domain-containing protein n=1 Tax=unclassified Bradyrhizobium TaxID=2631580 RepID=UPI0015CB1A57|nr:MULTISPECIES: 3-hydroxyacyl-CoA dehydrogenase NAD-binding domain-containing protein [unclassified Bradyrhizobium]MBB4260549.1 3-hydroxyacyl-CoA dehydrogenase [Bradyrhizobium sp. CIR3A]NYG46819.1 3-hydroxyacyl-CoA dehydrogenase [Bradyrhizobium sp. IAR9]